MIGFEKQHICMTFFFRLSTAVSETQETKPGFTVMI